MITILSYVTEIYNKHNYWCIDKHQTAIYKQIPNFLWKNE